MARGMLPADVPMLTRLACRLREETMGCGPWDELGVSKYVAEMKSWNFETVVEQILRKGTDPDARTPATLLKRGMSPLPSERPGGRYGGPPRKHEECHLHPGQRAANCGGCRADQLTGDRTPEPPPRRDLKPPPANFRELFDAARANTEEADHVEA